MKLDFGAELAGFCFQYQNEAQNVLCQGSPRRPNSRPIRPRCAKLSTMGSWIKVFVSGTLMPHPSQRTV